MIHWRDVRSPVAACWGVTLLVTQMALHALPTRSQEPSRSIEGRVHTTVAGPLPPDITVHLEEAEGVEVAKQLVGASGKFEFPNLKGALYRLVVTAKGYQTVRQDVDMDYVASRLPDIYLVPVAQKSLDSPSSSAASVTDLAAPKKARHEYEKGHRALQSGDPKEARTHLEKAVEEDPCYARAQTALGVALSMLREPAAAEAALKKALECDRAFLEARIQLGILLNVEGKYAENQVNLQEGLGRFPTEWQLHYQLGIACDGLKDYAKAEEEYLKAASINPAPPAEFHVKLADVCLKRKQWDKAYAEMQAYLRAEPNGEFAEETRSLMSRLESAGVLSKAR